VNAYQTQQGNSQNQLGVIDLQGAQRMPDVHAAIDRLDRLLDALAGITNAYGDRLTPVLRPEGLSTSKEASPGIKPIGTPMADRIEGICDTLEMRMNALGSLLHRLEI
jgi:hypothetical protein